MPPLNTPFYDAHIQAGARMVDFGGHWLPVHYGSQIQEHEAVRTDAGMFDVSHMAVTDIDGPEAKTWLRKLLANDVEKLRETGRALYSAMLNEAGGVMDDLIVYRMNDAQTAYRIIANAATRAKNLAWFEQTAKAFDVAVRPLADYALLAVQGPNARQKFAQAQAHLAEAVASLKPFQAASVGEWFVSRTGYTGEDGLEIMLPAAKAQALFEALLAAGVAPCGLGARDTLRLEAGMNLYGHDMDEQVTPLAAGMGWTIDRRDPARDFYGKAALQAPSAHQQAGLMLSTRAVLREGMKVMTDAGEGVITSGTFSPTLKCSIALARVPVDAQNEAWVEIRGVPTPVQLTAPPFVRHGQNLTGNHS